MNFIEKIEPFLISDDLIVQDFVLRALHDYPNVKKEWIERLVKEAMLNEEKRVSILIYLSIDPMNEEVASLLIEGALHAPIDQQHLYFQLFFDLAPELVLNNKRVLSQVIPNDYWRLYDILVNGTEESVWREYADILDMLEKEQYHHSDLYQRAKKIAYTLVTKGWITAVKLELVFKENLKKKWFDYDGILAVYMIGLMKNENLVPNLAPLLVRDEDILLEEVAAALISLQTDEVVKAVAPYLIIEDSNIFAASIIENIKTEEAIEVLRKAYHQVDDEEMQAIIIEALAHQLSEEAEPEINAFVSKKPTTFLYDLDELAYSYYKVIGIDHRLMDEWEKSIQMKDQTN